MDRVRIELHLRIAKAAWDPSHRAALILREKINDLLVTELVLYRSLNKVPVHWKPLGVLGVS